MIRDVRIKPVLNSRGDQTVRAEIVTERGTYSANAPSGKSKGEYEARALQFAEVKRIFPAVRKKLIGLDENLIDEKLGALGINKIGGNLAIALSIAGVRAMGEGDAWHGLGEDPRKFTFPYLLGNVLGGGAHGGNLSIQEILVIPAKAKDVKTAAKTNMAIWKQLSSELPGKIGTNDEGARTADIDEREALSIVGKVAKKFGAVVGIDAASGEMYKNGKYFWKSLGKSLSKAQQMDMILDLIKEFKLVYVEDPFIDTDWESFRELTKQTKILVCGDDLFATNPGRLRKGVAMKAARATIIKPDQIGLVSEAVQSINIAKRGGLAHVVSHRSGETKDAFIADLAVATGAPLLKAGVHSVVREAKAKRLIELWDKVKKPKMTKLRV